MTKEADLDARVSRRLRDLDAIAAEASHLVAKGWEAYAADTLDGALLRAAAQNILLRVATVAEILPTDFRDRHRAADWDKLRGMRNITAHHYDKVNPELVWRALRDRLPALMHTLNR